MSISVFYGTDKQELGNVLKNVIAHCAQKKILLIVPEQYSLSAEQEFSKVTKTDFEVINFKRLCRMIFEAAGKITGGYVSSASKIMIMQRVLDTYGSKLTVYGGCDKKPGFASAMAQTVSEFKHASVTPGFIYSKSEECEGIVKGKLSDFAMLFEEFNSFVARLGCDSDDDLSLAFELLSKNPALYGIKDSCIIISDFNGFTVQERRLVRLFADCASVYMTAVTDRVDDQAAVCFYQTVNNLKKLTEGLKAHFEHVKECEEKSVGRILSKNYFKYPCETAESDDIKIYSADDAYSEICRVACEIQRLCREEGYRYSDINIVYRSADTYCSILKRVLSMFDIPYFMDYRESVSQNPFVTFLYAMGEVFEYNFSYDSLINLIKSAFSPVSKEDADVFENFILEYGITGKYFVDDEQWAKKCSTASKSGRYDIQKMELVRQAVLTPLMKLREKTKGSVAFKLHARALFELLGDYNTYGVLSEISRNLSEGANAGEAQFFARIWNIFINLLDEIVAVMGDSTGSFLKFMSVLRAGLEDSKAGVIPPVVDCVTVSDGQRFVGGKIKAVFAVGVVNGEFPPSGAVGSVFDGTDRDILEGIGIELTNTRLSSAVMEQQILYKIFSAPSDKLYFSYRNSNSDGTASAPSEVIDRICSVFPKLEISCEMPSVGCPSYTFERLIASGDTESTDYGNAYKWFSGEPRWQGRLKALQYGKASNTVRLSEQSVVKLYSGGFYGSISKLERYGNCAFSYFVTYNLKAQPRRVYKIGAPDIGSLIHSCLEYSAVKIDKTYGWDSISEDICRDVTNEAVAEIAPEFLSGMLLSSPRYRYTLSKLTGLMSKNLYYIARQFSHSRFRPAGYEIKFGTGGSVAPIELSSSDGRKISLTGMIDRADTCKIGDTEYLRIIDYKSGTRELKLSDVYNGLNLQLLTYLDAVCGKEIKPAGVLYFKVTDSYDRLKNLMDEKLLKAYLKGNYKMSGLVLSDGEVLLRMDDELASLNVKEKKGGYSGDLVTASEFEILRRGVKKSIVKLCDAMLGGVIDINPVKSGDRPPCRYCEFGSICRSSDGCRKLVEFQNDAEVIARMADEGGVI